MGGNAVTDLLLPVGERRMSSWDAHINRGTPSSEPGTDFYCPIGTPIIAPADGVVWGSGNSIDPDTGRWIGIDFDNGMGFRTMHHSQNLITSGRVSRGQVFAISGASGYGEEDWSWNVADTGGAHVHATLWPTHVHRYGYDNRGRPYTIDLMNHVDRSATAGGKTVAKTILEGTMSNPIINVVSKVGDRTESGTLWYGADDGKFYQLVGYSRDLASVMLGSVAVDGGSLPLIIPSVATVGGDFEKIKKLWFEMKKR